jgi:hypothetical protein
VKWSPAINTTLFVVQPSQAFGFLASESAVKFHDRSALSYPIDMIDMIDMIFPFISRVI